MRRTSTAKWSDKYRRWQINVQKNGIRRSFYSSAPGRTGQRECNAKADAWLDDNITGNRLRVRQAAQMYMEHLQASTSKSHWRQYQNYVDNYLVKYAGHLHVEDVSEMTLQDIINRGSKKGLSHKTLLNMRACFQNFLKFCRRSKMTTLVCEDLIIPKNAPKGERSILQPADILTLLSEDTYITPSGRQKQEPCIYAMRFQVLTGLRPGEVLGLRRRDVDLKAGTVTISQAINYYGEITDGKNENAQRTFALNPLTESVLRKAMENSAIVSPYVFHDDYGEPFREHLYNKHLKRYCECHGMKSVTAYELRHTFVSITQHLDLSELKSLVGHSAAMDTLGTYAHELDGERQATARKVYDIFIKALEKEKSDHTKEA